MRLGDAAVPAALGAVLQLGIQQCGQEAQVALVLPQRLRRERGRPRRDRRQVQLPAGLADLGLDDRLRGAGHDATPQPQASSLS